MNYFLNRLRSFQLVFFILFVIFFEILCRVENGKVHEQLVRGHAEDETQTIYTVSTDPQLIYEYRKNAPGINAQGYRDNDDYPFVTQKDTMRVVVIGDSIAEGNGSTEGKRFPQVLKELLKRQVGQPVEVFVLARAGYAMSQELRILEREAGHYHPDLIVWSYCLNDPADPLYHFGNNEMGQYFSRPKSALASFISKKIFYFREMVLGFGKDKEYHRFLHDVYHSKVRKGVDKIGLWSKKHSVPILFYVHPVFALGASDFSCYPFLKIHRDLQMFAEENGIFFIDGLEVVRNLKREDVARDPVDPWHPNNYGHKLVAEQIASFIIDQQILKEIISPK